MHVENRELSERSVRTVAGISAILFAVGVVAANAAVGGGPMADASAADAAAWFRENSSRLAVANGLVGLTFPALIAFAAAMFELGRETRRARVWMTVGALGSVCMVGVFSILVAGNIAAVHLAGNIEMFEAVWRLHFAGFAINMTALGITFAGFSGGAHAAGLIPRWQRNLGLLGAVLLLVSGFANTAVAGGSLAVAPGGIGFLLWLVWLPMTGVRLLRSRDEAQPA